ncbi:M81 family metallopeptidase [Membranihabitans marinus]|uniref:M81 family metallopeptidase n=1 Tax=Membranihabitans marinus TaxID=1227546 RepID=UPI001F1AB686|nr:M81 family metallopeptidase [Membranihabitans marinus]
MKTRVALIGIYHESNTFLAQPTTYKNFEDGHLMFGEDIRREYADAHHEIGGILEVFDSTDIEIVPLVYAEATPGGKLTRKTYEKLLELMVSALRDSGSFDGIMVCPHGAAVAETYPDMDGHWLKLVRLLVGDHVPIVCTLDPHANVSPAMVDATNALVAYSSNPHLDQRETGRKAAKLMLQNLVEKRKLTSVLCQSRVSISIEQQFTSDYPCKALYELADKYLQDDSVLSISVILGFPYSDVEKMGSSFIVVTDNDVDKANEIGKAMTDYLESNKELFVGERIDAHASVIAAKQMDKPVLLLDMGDNVGGGSPGDATILLHALNKENDLTYFYCLYDPTAVEECMALGEGESIDLTMGGKSDDLHGSPVEMRVNILAIKNGVFQESEPRHGGQVQYNMGDIVIVETENRSVIMLISKRVPPFSLSQLTTFDVQPSRFDVLVAKGVQAPIAAYGPVCASMIRVDTPGVTRADATQLTYHHRRKPLFPFEKNIDE